MYFDKQQEQFYPEEDDLICDYCHCKTEVLYVKGDTYLCEPCAIEYIETNAKTLLDEIFD